MTFRFRPSRGGRTAAPPLTGPGWVPTLDRRDLDRTPLASHGVRLYTAGSLLVGTVRGQGRLSDILNLRGEVRLDDATIRRLGSPLAETVTVPAVVVDAFEIEIAMANRLPDEPWTRARRVHKVRYPSRVDAAPYTVDGWIHVFPGIDPVTMAGPTAPGLFLPVTRPIVRRRGHVVSDPTIDAVLVNRHLVRAIAPTDIEVAQDAVAVIERRRELALAPA